MIANVSAHRRANAFAQALEDRTLQDTAADRPTGSDEHPELEGLLALANGLGELPSPEFDPEVKVVQRAQLVAAMEAMLTEGGAPTGPQVPEQRTGRGAHRAAPLRKLRPRSRWSKGLAAGSLTVGVAAGAFGGVAAASSDALPGDSLYGLKRGMEDIKLGMADDNADRGRIYLDQASTRLGEARRLMERGRIAELDHESLSEVRRTLNGMRHDASEGHRLLHEAYERDGSLGPIQTLSSFSRSQRESWSRLRRQLPAQLTDVSDEVNSVFDAIDEEVGPLRSMLPRAPEPGGGASNHKDPGQDDTPDPSGPSRRQPSAPAADSTDGSTTPQPSSSTGSDGLLGGSAGDLLDPPQSSTSASPQTGKGSSAPGPDITIPPLLPGLLPGLGIDGEDAK
ncbi:DUF5667 domain-containing protein [Streptomyces sannanensis]|uniref:DUF5667 domain-containing protein n=1 Tax=Streptomyces sannanensis TaxID=285536 RepID=A0ABP6SDA9_9ACTN